MHVGNNGFGNDAMKKNRASTAKKGTALEIVTRAPTDERAQTSLFDAFFLVVTQCAGVDRDG